MSQDYFARETENLQKAQAVLLAGPTASGKSARAIELAQKIGGVVINADSMAVYRELRILSARPTEAEMAGVPHWLFGHVEAARNYSVGLWLKDAESALAEARRQRKTPIFVGGTGLYFKILTQGVSNIPDVPAAVREKIRREAEGVDAEILHRRLSALDPDTAQKLRPTDRQRILRALEIFVAFQTPLAQFQGARTGALLEAGACACLFLAPERQKLFARIDARFNAMMAAGALEEVAALAQKNLDPDLPAMRAVGVPGLLAVVRQEATLDQAIEKGQRDSRHYAKRQYTFARTQLPDFKWLAVD